jgi:hypothetical protein
MPNRIPPNEAYTRKAKCAITFKFPVEIPFSISTTDKISEDFKYAVGQNALETSAVIRNLLFKELGIKTRKDIDDMMERVINEGREIIYKRLNVNKKMPFSKVAESKMLKYIKANRGVE